MKNSNKIKIITINDKYIEYLQTFDSKVMNQKKYNTLRNYVGVLIHIEDIPYYVPLSSGNKVEKDWLKKHNRLVSKIFDKDKLIAYLRFAYMVPVHSCDCEETKIDPLDKKGRLLLKEFLYIKEHQHEITHKAELVIRNWNKKDHYFISRCVDFSKLNEAYRKYRV